MTITELIKQLKDMKLLYGDKTILTVTDGESEYRITSISGNQCAKYFEPTDHVAEAVVRICRK